MWKLSFVSVQDMPGKIGEIHCCQTYQCAGRYALLSLSPELLLQGVPPETVVAFFARDGVGFHISTASTESPRVPCTTLFF
jgi:hypothetical protein